MGTPQKNVLLTTLTRLLQWSKQSSLLALPLDLSCCGAEMMAAYGPRYDMERVGSGLLEVFATQADVMIIAGTITTQFSKELLTLYEQMAFPKYVIAMGGCAIGGGPYAEFGYSVVKGAETLVPVDIYIPGCPPRPEALIHGILKLNEKIGISDESL